MATVYEIRRGTEVSGPFTGAELRKMVVDGTLHREDGFRVAGVGEWQPAGRSAKLFQGTEGVPSSAEILAVPDVLASISTAPRSPTPKAATPAHAPAAPTTAPVPQAEGRPSAALLALAGLAGGAFALGLSPLKPSVGALGIVGVVGGLGLVLAATWFLMNSAVAPLAAQLGTDHPAVVGSRSRVGRVASLGGLAVLVAAVGSLTEFATPGSGLTRTMLSFAAPKPPPPAPHPPAASALDAKPWSAAHFVLVDPGRDAVAVRQDADPPAFRLLSLVSGAQVREAMKVAVSNGVQIIDEKPDLAHRIAAVSEPGLVPGRLAAELGELWRVHQYLPAQKTLVTFQDVREGKSRVGFLADRRPEEITFVPLAPKRAPKGAGSDLFVTEVIRRADLRTGSQRVGLNDDQARKTADFLDYTVYQILEKLSATQRGAGYVRVVVYPVTYDDKKLKGIKEQAATLSERYLKELKTKADGNIVDETVKAKHQGTVQEQRSRRYLGQRARAKESASQGNAPTAGNPQYGIPPVAGTPRQEFETELEARRGTEDEDTRVDFEQSLDLIKNRSIRGDAEAKRFMHEFDLEEKRLRAMEDETGLVTSELRTRLIDAGVSVLEQSRLDALETERALARRRGTDEAAAEQFLGATHVLIAEIRDRRGQGQYHLSTRLVKVGTRETVAEVEGERTPPTSVPYTPPVDTPFMLQTGQLVVVEFADDVRPRTDLKYQDYPGGYPVKLPAVELVALTKDDEKAEYDRKRVLKVWGQLGPKGKLSTDPPPFLAGMNLRLGFLDDPGTPDPKQSPYRKLVGTDLRNGEARKGLPADRVPFRDLFGDEPSQLDLSKIKSISEANGNTLPDAHRMRYTVYQIASSILPPAGRITSTGAGDLHTVSLGHRSKLNVSDRLRVLRPGLSDRLEFELQVREVQDAFSRVIFDRNESLFADRYGPQVGDLVHRRADRTVSLAVLPFKVEDINPDGNGNANGANNAAPNRPRMPGFPALRPMRNAGPPPQRGREAQRQVNEELKSNAYILKLANELHGKLREALINRCNVPLADATAATHVLEGRVTFASDKDLLIPAHIKVTERATGKIVLEQDFKFTAQEGRKWKP